LPQGYDWYPTQNQKPGCNHTGLLVLEEKAINHCGWFLVPPLVTKPHVDLGEKMTSETRVPSEEAFGAFYWTLVLKDGFCGVIRRAESFQRTARRSYGCPKPECRGQWLAEIPKFNQASPSPNWFALTNPQRCLKKLRCTYDMHIFVLQRWCGMHVMKVVLGRVQEEA
jgi:hypothetical protein